MKYKLTKMNKEVPLELVPTAKAYLEFINGIGHINTSMENAPLIAETIQRFKSDFYMKLRNQIRELPYIQALGISDDGKTVFWYEVVEAKEKGEPCQNT